MTTKNERTFSNPSNFLEVLKESNVDISRPTEIRDFLETFSVNVIEKFFPLVASKLFASGIHRELDKHGAKVAKVGTPEYKTFVESWFEVWQRGYLTPREEEKALKPVTAKKGGRAQALPFSIAEICARMRLLAPSGKSDKAIRVHATIDKLESFRVEAFTAYYAKSLENHESLMVKAVKELSDEKVENLRIEQQELLGDVELI